ncbi:unnamed protein product [Adineta ricciae]|uniref:UDP-N-acetylglucosamine--peptide N-acetylglucosaminyltransferase SPINDLY n=1 Tax=Adineta ricciae TaxID=249248 RepID=A0A815B940_ADIRI|nr:unnamed protein product [Adineta ricciae]
MQPIGSTNRIQPITTSTSASIESQIDLQRIRHAFVLWYDITLSDNDENYRNMLTQLQNIVANIKIFVDEKKCITFIESVKNNKICLMTTDHLAQRMAPLIHKLSQIECILTYSNYKIYSEDWFKSFPKVRGIFRTAPSLYKPLKKIVHQCEINATPISFIPNSIQLNELDRSFMYIYLLKNTFLQIDFKATHIKAFVNYCYDVFAGNEKELNNIGELDRDYHKKTPVYWYTRNSFLSPMLTQALRLLDGDIITRMAFFIVDLHRYIKNLRREQIPDDASTVNYVVCRGQGLSKADFKQLEKNQGGLISFNNFILTNRCYQVGLKFAKQAIQNPDLIGILFVIKVDSIDSVTPFASIYNSDHCSNKADVIFSMPAIFRIQKITRLDRSQRLYQVDLLFVKNNDKTLSVIDRQVQEESLLNAEGWFRLCFILSSIGDFKKAEQIYQTLLDQTNDENEEANIYYQLGLIKYKTRNYPEAMKFYEKALAIYERNLPHSQHNLIVSYNNIGLIYYDIGDYPNAMLNYEKALEIQQTSSSDRSDVALSLSNKGAVYSSTNKHSKAFECYKKAFIIQQQSLPINHRDLMMSYNNFGTVYSSMGDDSTALLYYEKAQEIHKKLLPLDHRSFTLTSINTGNVHNSKGDFPKAVEAYEKAHAILKETLPPNHCNLASSYNNLGTGYFNTGDYLKARSCYEKALEIQNQSLPSDHSDLIMSYNNLGAVHHSLGNYSEALSNLKKVRAIMEKTLPPDDRNLASCYNSIGQVQYNMNDYSDALSSHTEAHAILIRKLPPKHLLLVASFNNLGLIHFTLDDYSQALSCYEQALKILQDLPTTNSLDLCASYNNIALTYFSMGDYQNALSYFVMITTLVKKLNPPDEIRIASSYRNLAATYHKLGDYRKAHSHYKETLSLQKHILRFNHPETIMTYNSIGSVYESEGKHQMAVNYYKLAVEAAAESLPRNDPHQEKYQEDLKRATKNL